MFDSLHAYVFLDVHIFSDTLIVSQMATVTCISSVAVQQIKWLYGEQVVVMATSQQMLNLTFLVEDSMHNETYTCLVTAVSNITVTQTVTMNVSGKCGSTKLYS